MLFEPEVFNRIVTERRAVRAFTDKAASQETLNQVFSAAQRAPSNCNTQPWVPYVVSGEACDRLRAKVLAAWQAGQITMDFPFEGKYDGAYKDRQHAAAQTMYSAMGVERDDKAGRNEQFLKNFEFFDAPHVCFMFLHQDFGIREAADVGMYAQSLMLSLSAHGLASCPQTALSFFADLIRSELDIPAELKLLFGISFGYEDTSAPVNNCVTERELVDKGVHFIS